MPPPSVVIRRGGRSEPNMTGRQYALQRLSLRLLLENVGAADRGAYECEGRPVTQAEVGRLLSQTGSDTPPLTITR